MSNLKYEYKKGSIEAAPARNLNLYEKITGVSRNELVGKRILDLGASRENLFAKELKEAGIECEVLALSPDFSDPKYAPLNEGLYVAGVAQALPFKDESFDYVFDVGGPSVHASKPNEIKEWIPEVVRVLKKNGQYSAFFYGLDMTTLMKINGLLISQGHQAKSTKVPNEPFLHEKITKMTGVGN